MNIYMEIKFVLQNQTSQSYNEYKKQVWAFVHEDCF